MTKHDVANLPASLMVVGYWPRDLQDTVTSPRRGFCGFAQGAVAA